MAKYLTPEGLEKMKKELDYLKTAKRKEVAELLRHTASFGDLKENAAYDAAKEEQGFVERRISELNDIISQAVIIDKKENNSVQIGSKVFLKSDDNELDFQIVGPEEADILKGKLSFRSPLGEAVLDKKEGEIFKFLTPEGEKKYRVLRIE